jgi:PKD repeat protein
MKRITFIAAACGFLLVLTFASCKKDAAEDTTPLLVDFSLKGNTGVSTLPATVTLLAEIPEGADVVSWTFPDGSTATGDSVVHTFNAYGNYQVTCSASKGSRNGSITKGTPVLSYKRFQIKALDVKQTEPNSSGTFGWDDFGNKPDLAYRITMPDGSAPYITNDAQIKYDIDTGRFVTNPTIFTSRFDGYVKVEVLDVDTGETPKYVYMGGTSFYIGDYVTASGPYVTTIPLQKNLTKLEVIVGWIP